MAIMCFIMECLHVERWFLSLRCASHSLLITYMSLTTMQPARHTSGMAGQVTAGYGHFVKWIKEEQTRPRRQ